MKNYNTADLRNEFDVRSNPLSEDRIKLFTRLIRTGVTMPPIEVYQKEDAVYVKDGRTRLEAHRRLNKKTIKGIEVPYTTKKQMLIEAFAANVTKTASPLPPTEADFSTVIRQLARENASKEEVVSLLIKSGTVPAYAKHIVSETFHSMRKLDEVHAVEAVTSGRMTIVEAAVNYGVSVTIVKRKLAVLGDYGLDKFGLDVSKKLTTLRKFVGDKLRLLEDRGGPALKNEALNKILHREVSTFQRWVEASEVSAR